EVAEWSIAAVLKTVELKGSRGSNPCLSAKRGKSSVDNLTPVGLNVLRAFLLLSCLADFVF
ncbi:MAG: hypothetical protein LBN06_11015, partial [Prevotellaceae bacterium]|nr:hypothetical protein [Prevotellaceae bacterium]